MIIIGLLYFIIYLTFLASGIFILYHIIRYSYSKTAMLLMVLGFSSVMGILLIINLALFLSLDFSEILAAFNL